jgi:hypothetical protein
MRKIDPAGVKKDFLEALDDVESTLSEVKESLLSDGAQSLVAESSLLASAVLWEGFTTDLFVAYINRDSEQLARQLVARVVQSVKDKFGTIIADKLDVAMPRHLDEKEVRTLLDPKDYNLSFDSADGMITRAVSELPKSASAKFIALTDRDRATIDAWHGLRNFIAHRSQSSKDRMNKMLKAPAVPDSLKRKQRQVHDVAGYLMVVRNGEWRVQSYVSMMKAIAQKL